MEDAVPIRNILVSKFCVYILLLIYGQTSCYFFRSSLSILFSFYVVKFDKFNLKFCYLCKVVVFAYELVFLNKQILFVPWCNRGHFLEKFSMLLWYFRFIRLSVPFFFWKLYIIMIKKSVRHRVNGKFGYFTGITQDDEKIFHPWSLHHNNIAWFCFSEFWEKLHVFYRFKKFFTRINCVIFDDRRV